MDYFHFWKDRVDTLFHIPSTEHNEKPCMSYIESKHKKTEKWRGGRRARDLKI